MDEVALHLAVSGRFHEGRAGREKVEEEVVAHDEQEDPRGMADLHIRQHEKAHSGKGEVQAELPRKMTEIRATACKEEKTLLPEVVRGRRQGRDADACPEGGLAERTGEKWQDERSLGDVKQKVRQRTLGRRK